MTIEVAHADEVCESKLFQRRRSSVSNRLCGRHRLYQRFGQDEIRQPQSWKQNFGERSQVNSAAFPVESGQRLKRWSVIAIFAVVVILNDECPYTGGPIQKLNTSDRKSTRLNSSHLGISYAVFCLKKKKKSKT